MAAAALQPCPYPLQNSFSDSLNGFLNLSLSSSRPGSPMPGHYQQQQQQQQMMVSAPTQAIPIMNTYQQAALQVLDQSSFNSGCYPPMYSSSPMPQTVGTCPNMKVDDFSSSGGGYQMVQYPYAGGTVILSRPASPICGGAMDTSISNNVYLAAAPPGSGASSLGNYYGPMYVSNPVGATSYVYGAQPPVDQYGNPVPVQQQPPTSSCPATSYQQQVYQQQESVPHYQYAYQHPCALDGQQQTVMRVASPYGQAAVPMPVFDAAADNAYYQRSKSAQGHHTGAGSAGGSYRHPSGMRSAPGSPTKPGRHGGESTLPGYCLTDHGEIGISLANAIDRQLIKAFAVDRVGRQFIKDEYENPRTPPELKAAVFQALAGTQEVFDELVKCSEGNWALQTVIKSATPAEEKIIFQRMEGHVLDFCKDRLALELDEHVAELSRCQNANHVIQRILKHCNDISFVVKAFIRSKGVLREVVEDKYGCRVVQEALEQMAIGRGTPQLMKMLVNAVIEDGDRFITNEYANYIVQHILVADGTKTARKTIIDNFLQGNLLSLAQEKHSSHVLEKAFEHAAESGIHLLDGLMKEVFHGYQDDPTTGRTALDVMMFDQFGNYVVQTMLKIATQYACDPDPVRRDWLKIIASRVAINKYRLSKYSSGKKIIEELKKALEERNMNKQLSDLDAPYVRNALAARNNNNINNNNNNHNNNNNNNGQYINNDMPSYENGNCAPNGSSGRFYNVNNYGIPPPAYGYQQQQQQQPVCKFDENGNYFPSNCGVSGPVPSIYYRNQVAPY